MAKPKTYVGIDNDINGGMTSIGKLIRDAWLFDLIEESETCIGWNFAMIDGLLDKVNKEWDKHGLLVSNLPPELFEKHQRIHNKGMDDARAAGWCGEHETDDDH